MGRSEARKTFRAPVEAIALRVSFFVSTNSGAKVAGASGPYVDQPSTYSQTIRSPNSFQPLAESPNVPVTHSVMLFVFSSARLELQSPVMNGPRASTSTGMTIIAPVTYENH